MVKKEDRKDNLSKPFRYSSFKLTILLGQILEENSCSPPSLGLAVVEVERVVVVVVGLDAVQVEQHVVELLEQEEAGRHALPPRYRVTFTGTP